MDVPCQNCGELYSCEDHKYMGFCNYCKTNIAIGAKPGSKLLDKYGAVWIRMKDDPDGHLEGCYFNFETGEYCHASHIIYP